MARSLDQLRSAAASAREKASAAEEKVLAAQQASLEAAQKACDLEAELEKAETVKAHEDAGHTLEIDSEGNMTVAGLDSGPNYDDTPGG